MKENNDTLVVGKKLLIAVFVLIGAFLILQGFTKITVEDEYVEVGHYATIYDAKATLFWFDVSKLVKKSGEVDLNKVGTYEIRYSTISIPSKTCVKQVIVRDTVAPKVYLMGDEEVNVESFESYIEPGYVSLDMYDGDISQETVVTVEKDSETEYRILYTVKDNSGNETVAERKVHIRANTGIVYLTFDDGPSLTVTPRILDILEKYEVKATFFVVGFGDDAVSIVQRENMGGHTIGLHGFSHEYSEIYTSVETLMENFQKVGDLVGNATKIYHVQFIRFPGGSSNTVSKKYCKGIMTDATKFAEEMGYTYFDWNVDSDDAGGARTADEIYQNVITGLVPGRTNVVLMHDSQGHQATADALERIIVYCTENGYELKAISGNTAEVHHKVNN